MNHAILVVIAAGCGAVLGSFCSTFAGRWARHEQAIWGRSHCDNCFKDLGFAQTIPIASYFASRGACVHCQSRISPLHLVGEIGGALIAVCAVGLGDPLRATALGLIGFVLLTASCIDALVQILPDYLTLTVAVLAIGLAAINGPDRLGVGLTTALVLGIVLLAVRALLNSRFARQSLGLGDIKLLTALSFWLGLAMPLVLILAAVIGLIAMVAIRPANGRLAFGPAIALGAWCVGLGQELGVLWL